MLTIWIIHRDAHHRAALARIAGAGDSAVLGSPSDRIFESAAPPGAVLLGLSGDFERELEFVHRFGARLRRSSWILLPAAGDIAESRRLFDTLHAQHVPYPPNPTVLRRALRSALQRRRVDSLSSRRGRDALRDRFARWFADLELDELMRAIDPRMADVPVLIRGDEGTGRTLLARYIHEFGGTGDDGFIHVSCRNVQSEDALLEQLAAGRDPDHIDAVTLWLEDVDQLPVNLQRRVQDWIEFGLPDAATPLGKLRWIAGAGDEGDLDADPGLDPQLAEALSGMAIRIPTLHERQDSIDAFVADTALAWANRKGERARTFSPEALKLLRAYPWPGNLHELEAVVLRTLAFSSANPILPVHLRFPGDSGWLDQWAADPHMSSDDDMLSEEFTPEQRAVLEPLRETDLPEADILEEERGYHEVEVVGELETFEDVLAPLNGPQALHEPQALDGPQAFDEPKTSGAPMARFGAQASDRPAQPSAGQIAQDAAEALMGPAPERGAVAVAADGPAAAPAASGATAESELRRLVRAITHDVRNPLVSIRTFSELLPDHYDDPEFRDHFRELVGQDVVRIDEAVNRLQNMVDMGDNKSVPVDIGELLESLLAERRGEIEQRRLLVLKELDHSLPHALGDPLQLRDAFGGLVKRALEGVSDRGDIYIASKHHSNGLAGGPSVRVLIRHTVGGTKTRAAAPTADLDMVMAEAIVKACGGALTVDGTDAQESVVVIDLPAPA